MYTRTITETSPVDREKKNYKNYVHMYENIKRI